MADSIDDILAGKDWGEPPVIGAIKQYIQDKYDARVSIRLNNEQIIITVDNSLLASSLRSNLIQLKRSVKTDKNIILRIG